MRFHLIVHITITNGLLFNGRTACTKWIISLSAYNQELFSICIHYVNANENTLFIRFTLFCCIMPYYAITSWGKKLNLWCKQVTKINVFISFIQYVSGMQLFRNCTSLCAKSGNVVNSTLEFLQLKFSKLINPRILKSHTGAQNRIELSSEITFFVRNFHVKNFLLETSWNEIRE